VDTGAQYVIRATGCPTCPDDRIVAVTDTRHTRHRGLAETHLEHLYSAVALNLIRLDAWFNGLPLDRTRTSRLSRLELALAA
jgi:hypothetical protein